jgi:hypothetical protein
VRALGVLTLLIGVGLAGRAGAAPTSSVAPALPVITATVAGGGLIGVGLETHHHDADGHPESADGRLVLTVDPELGPYLVMQDGRPHSVEAQVANLQRDAVLLAREDGRADERPDGTRFEIPYGWGALKTNLAIVTLIEARLAPHFADNHKRYTLFPLSDLYLGGAVSVSGVHAELRYVHTEQTVVYGQLGLNPLAMAGATVGRTWAAFAVPLRAGGGWRYPSPLRFLGTHWTSGLELLLGLGAADEPIHETAAVVFLPGLVQELEWTWRRDLDIEDHRADPRPSDWGVHALFARVGLYLDAFSGRGGTGGLLVDVSVGYRFNLLGPDIPEHAFKATEVTWASARYVARKRDEEARRRALEDALRRRGTP